MIINPLFTALLNPNKYLLRICLLQLLIINAALAQKSEYRVIDSLLPIIQKQPKDTNLVKNLCRISRAYFIIDHEKGIQCGEQALALSKQLDWGKGIAKSHSAIATSCWAKSNYIRALDEYQKAIVIFEKLHLLPDVVNNFASIAAVNYAQKDYRKALENYERANNYIKTHFSDLTDKTLQYEMWVNMAMTYRTLGEKEKSVELYSKAIEGFRKVNKQEHLINAMLLLAEVYSPLKERDKAFKLLKEAERLAIQLGFKKRIGNCYLHQSFYYKQIKSYKLALQKSQQAADIFSEEKEDGELALAIFNMGDVLLDEVNNDSLQHALSKFQKTEKINQAIHYFTKGISLAEPVSDRVSMKSYYQQLSDAYLLVNDYKNAFKASQKYQEIKDSLDLQENSKSYLVSQFEFEYARKSDSIIYSKRLDSLAIKNNLELSHIRQTEKWIIAVTCLLLLVGFLIYLFQRNTVKADKLKKALEAEQLIKEIQDASYKSKLNDLTLAALKSQMNPHFIFNCLNSIKLYTEQNDSENASSYLTKFSKLIRKMLDLSEQDTITLSDEILLLNLYLDMEKMRLKEKLHVQLDYSDSTDFDFIRIPSMMVQPFLENAIWHGLMPKKDGGCVKVQMISDNIRNIVLFMIEDNGIGLSQSLFEKSKHTDKHISRGNKIVSEKIRLLKEKYGKECEVEVIDLSTLDSSAIGTKVIIKLPIL